MRHNSCMSFFLGQRELLGAGCDAHKILNICMEQKIIYRDFTVDSDGNTRLWCSPYMSYILLRACRESRIELRRGKSFGLPYILWNLRKRRGLLLGMLAAVIMVVLSENYIWDIRITGNQTVTYTQLTESLEECGLYVGSRIQELDVDAIESKVALSNKNISWIAINIVGTHANIQIRESGEAPNDIQSTNPSNLIAARDGQIEYLEIFGGNPIVKSGDTVRKGDILVSGIWDSNHYGLFVTRSVGKVYARTIRDFKIEVSFEYEEKILEKRKTEEKYLIFFSKEIKVFENAGNDGAMCDTIESVEKLRFFNGDILPIGIKTVDNLFYRTEARRYTESEAMNIAYYRLNEQIRAELPNGEILKKTVRYEVTDNSYVLYCTVHCIEDIAIVQDFEFVFPNG